jgi:hypothetical protein
MVVRTAVIVVSVMSARFVSELQEPARKSEQRLIGRQHVRRRFRWRFATQRRAHEFTRGRAASAAALETLW